MKCPASWAKMRNPRTRMKEKRLRTRVSAICFWSAAQCNIDSARFVPGPAIPMQRILDGPDCSGLAGVPVQHAVHDVYDSHEGKFSGQEALDRDLVGGVEHGRHRAASAKRGVRELNGWEPLRVDGQEIELTALAEVQPRERRGYAIGIEQRVLDGKLHVRRRQLRDDRAIDVLDHRMHDRLR